MHSPIINKSRDNNIIPFNLINSKTTKNKALKKDINNSSSSKKLILSRNNFSNKNYFLKTKNNSNSYKKIILNKQLSSDNSSPINTNTKKQNNTTANINKNNIKNINSKAQLLLYKKNDNRINHDTLYKDLISKINESNNLYNNNKFDFSMNILINNSQNKDKNNFNKINHKSKNNINKKYYQKIFNFPLSPINKNVKSLKLNNIKINDNSGSFKNLSSINKEKRITSGKYINSNNSNQIKIENSFIYNNTNNINLNVNIINKRIVNDENNTSLIKIKAQNKNIINNSSINNIFINKNEQNKIRQIKHHHNESENLIYNYSIGNLTNRVRNKAIKIKPIEYNINNNELFSLSSFIKVDNKEENIYAEEVHFKAVKYMQEIKQLDII